MLSCDCRGVAIHVRVAEMHVDLASALPVHGAQVAVDATMVSPPGPDKMGLAAKATDAKRPATRARARVANLGGLPALVWRSFRLPAWNGARRAGGSTPRRAAEAVGRLPLRRTFPVLETNKAVARVCTSITWTL